LQQQQQQQHQQQQQQQQQHQQQQQQNPIVRKSTVYSYRLCVHGHFHFNAEESIL